MGSPFNVKIPSSGSLLASTSYTNEIPYPDLIRSMIILKLEMHICRWKRSRMRNWLADYRQVIENSANYDKRSQAKYITKSSQCSQLKQGTYLIRLKKALRDKVTLPKCLFSDFYFYVRISTAILLKLCSLFFIIFFKKLLHSLDCYQHTKDQQ